MRENLEYRESVVCMPREEDRRGGVEGLTSFIGGDVGELLDRPESICECKPAHYALSDD